MASSSADSQPLIILSYSSWCLSIDAQPNCQQGRDLSNPGAKWVTESQSGFFALLLGFPWVLASLCSNHTHSSRRGSSLASAASCLPMSALLITAVDGFSPAGHRRPILPSHCSYSSCSEGKWRHLGLVEFAAEVIHQVSRWKANHMNKMCHLG